jgi:competence protein ComEC
LIPLRFNRTQSGVPHFKRPLIPSLGAYVAGLWWFGELWRVNHAIAGCILLAFVALLAGWVFIRRESTPAFVAAFFLLGIGRMAGIDGEERAADAALSRFVPGQPVYLSGLVRAADFESDAGRFRFTVCKARLGSDGETTRLPGNVLVSVLQNSNRQPPPLPVPGQWIGINGQIGKPEGFRNFLSTDYAERLRRQRVYATLKVTSPESLQIEPGSGGLYGGIRGFLVSARKHADRALRSHMPEHEARLTISMVFNDRRMLTEQDVATLRDSGTFHLFAVSGLHVVVFAFILLVVLRSLRLSSRWSWTAISVLLFFYVLTLDFVAPATRAMLMAMAVTLGRWMRREVDAPSSLAFGCAVILVLEPLALWQPGFILSAMGVLAILSFLPLFGLWMPASGGTEPGPRGATVLRGIVDGFHLTLAITLVLLPLQFYYFQRFNLLSPLVNVAAAGFSTPLLGGALATVALDSVSSPLAHWVGAATGGVMRLTYVVSSLTAAQDWAIVRSPKPPLAIVFAYYVVLFSGYYMVRRDSPEFAKKSFARISIHSSAAVLILFLTVAWRVADHPLRIWFLDVGQGDATLVELPSGQSVLVDTGNGLPNIGRLVVEPHLRTLGIRKLDNLVVTHSDSDHAGSVPWLLSNFPVSTLVHGATIKDSGELVSADVAARFGSPRVVPVCEIPEWSLDSETSIEVLNPECGETSAVLSDNNQSVMIRITHGQFSALLTGDAEKAVEQRLVAHGLRPCDVLKVGHHGSATASSAELLSAVKPRVAVISCGRRNRYGHPNPAVVERLRSFGASVYRTDCDGAVLVESDGKSFTVQTAVPDSLGRE